MGVAMNESTYEMIDYLIDKMVEKILDDIEESERWIAEDVNALARLIEARAKL